MKVKFKFPALVIVAIASLALAGTAHATSRVAVTTAPAASPSTVAIPDSVPAGPSIDGLAKGAVNALIYVAGIASVIVIIVGGIMLTTSAGNPDRTKLAKNAILYAVIGLTISLLAFAIVRFVLGYL